MLFRGDLFVWIWVPKGGKRLETDAGSLRHWSLKNRQRPLRELELSIYTSQTPTRLSKKQHQL